MRFILNSHVGRIWPADRRFPIPVLEPLVGYLSHLEPEYWSKNPKFDKKLSPVKETLILSFLAEGHNVPADLIR